MCDPKPRNILRTDLVNNNHDRDRSGIWAEEHADALYIANQIEFARAMVDCAQKGYDAGKTAAGDGALYEAERAIAQAVGIASRLVHTGPAVKEEIRVVRELLSNLRRPA